MRKKKDSRECSYCLQYSDKWIECDDCGLTLCIKCSLGLMDGAYCIDCFLKNDDYNFKKEVSNGISS